ncbi:MAG: hypothetical protein PHU25_17265 [Deltaproteobacteria bacterium]|nr:hypothetical protein [Deltaproteobacteria bacterium]
MKREHMAGVLLVLLLGAGIAGVAYAASGTSAGCVDWRSEAVFNGTGYNHLVHLTSRCDKPVGCDVSTDVNPAPIKVELEPGRSQTVNTFLGSPATAFTPKVTCKKK